MKSKSGLTNHEKICSERGETMSAQQPTYANAQDVDQDLRSNDRLDRDDHRDHSVDRRSNGKPKQGPFQFGAFFIMSDHIPILLDIDFCLALSAHILENGSSNSAIMAFAHQLSKLDGEGE